jgi:diguanylate cyclase (GGDEF)-like protein
MTLDIRPFWLIGALAATGCGFLVLVVKKTYPDHLGRVLSLWGVANVCLGVGYAIRLGPSWEGQLVFNVLSSTLITTCLSVQFWAMRELKRQPLSAAWVAAPPLLVFAVCVWFTFVRRNVSIELLIFDFINLALMILIALCLWRKEDGRRLFVDVVAASFYLLLGIATCVVIADFFRDGRFPPEYDFNIPRAVFDSIASILTEGIVFPLFLLMVSERLNRDLVAKALRDSLTGLYNRRAFEEIAFREISGAARTGLGLSVAIFDIDHFKQINDRHGHAAGDAVLSAVAATLRHNLRDEDFVCRWGGDEFCALLPRAQREQAQRVAERILQALDELDILFEERTIKVAVSIGVVTDEGRAKDISVLVGQADAALYRAKAAGRKRIAFAFDLDPEPGGSPLS